MEIVFVIGMLISFLLGAYIRAPFSFVKKEKTQSVNTENVLNDKTEEEKTTLKQFYNLLNYNGKPQDK